MATVMARVRGALAARAGEQAAVVVALLANRRVLGALHHRHPRRRLLGVGGVHGRKDSEHPVPCLRWNKAKEKSRVKGQRKVQMENDAEAAAWPQIPHGTGKRWGEGQENDALDLGDCVMLYSLQASSEHNGKLLPFS